jgi:hypothetical protein
VVADVDPLDFMISYWALKHAELVVRRLQFVGKELVLALQRPSTEDQESSMLVLGAPVAEDAVSIPDASTLTSPKSSDKQKHKNKHKNAVVAQPAPKVAARAKQLKFQFECKVSFFVFSVLCIGAYVFSPATCCAWGLICTSCPFALFSLSYLPARVW